MNLKEYSDKVERLRTGLSQKAADAARIAALDLVAAIADRVIEDGRNADLNMFSPYSTKAMPAWRYFGKSVNPGGEARVRAAAKANKRISYADFRRMNNRPTETKNFSFSNRMWRDFGVLSVSESGGVVSVTIGGRTAEAKRKIAENSKREGISIIKPSPIELANFRRKIVSGVIAEI